MVIECPRCGRLVLDRDQTVSPWWDVFHPLCLRAELSDRRGKLLEMGRMARLEAKRLAHVYRNYRKITKGKQPSKKKSPWWIGKFRLGRARRV